MSVMIRHHKSLFPSDVLSRMLKEAGRGMIMLKLICYGPTASCQKPDSAGADNLLSQQDVPTPGQLGRRNSSGTMRPS
jgi:hypothetical protein